MPKYWMINDRSQGGVGPDVNFDGVTYWVSDKQPLTDIKNWRQVTSLNFQKLLAAAWTRKNQPLLVSLVNQLLMVAADVDSDLFDMGAPDNNDGNAVANLTYRITALYTGRDSVLSASA